MTTTSIFPMLVLEVGDVPKEPIYYSTSEVPVLVTSTSSLELEHQKMKARLGAIGSHLHVQNKDKSTGITTITTSAAQERPAERQTAKPDVKPGCLPPGSAGGSDGKGQGLKEARPRSSANELADDGFPAADEEELQDPKEVLQKFLTRFKHMAVIKPVPAATKGVPQTPDRKSVLKPEAQHFTVGTPEEGISKTPTSPPGLGTREYPPP